MGSICITEFSYTVQVSTYNSFIYTISHLFLQSQEDLWLSSAQKLTNIIKQIIEFAKMVPGFMKFAQDDQIALLKRGMWQRLVLLIL